MTDASFSGLMAHASILMQHFQWPDALEVISRAVIVARQQCERDDRPLAKALENLAIVCKELGRDLDAERALHESTTILLKHVRLRGLGLANLQKYAEAEQEYRAALGICEKSYGPDHVETATCLDNLATCLRIQSRFVEAIALCDRARVIREKVHGEHHGHTAMSYANLGQLCRILGQHEKAEHYLMKSLLVREAIYGTDHHFVAESLDRLASVYRDLGRFDDAIPLGERCVTIRRASLGPDHPLTAAALHNLALTRERRPGELVISTETPAEIDEPAAEAEPETVAEKPTAAAEPDHADHVPGALIAVCLALGLVVIAATLVYVPLLGGLLFVVAWLLYMLGATGILPVQVYAKRALAGLSSMLWEPDGVDRDSRVLGRKSPAGYDAIITSSRNSALTARDARELVQLGRDVLDLDFLSSLTQAAADELANHRGTLVLNGLTHLPSKLAKSLRWHEGRLELDGVHELTDAAAAHIARHAGDLSLGGLRTLTKSVAQHLAHHRGVLELNGVRSMRTDEASWLIKHRGPVQLHSCRLISEETQRVLRSNPAIDFPDRNAGGMM